MLAAENLTKKLWEWYRTKIPQVRAVEAALQRRGDVWAEDHIAFRTFPGSHVGAHVIAGIFQAMGYEKRDSYDFREKKLSAFWLEPPAARGNPHASVLPKVFVSELRVKELSEKAQRIVERYTNDVESSPLSFIETLARNPKDTSAQENIAQVAAAYLTAGAPWRRPLRADYETLLAESEYAAWTLLFGPVPNHFTVCTHLMRTFPHISDLNLFLENDLKISMNRAGGGILKGSPEVGLEQSATLAFPTWVTFQDECREVPLAYIEFAHRWPLPGRQSDGIWDSYYQGFVTDNADKIFESTFLNRN